jgi:tetratricopeptide (TPR) repeat protein
VISSDYLDSGDPSAYPLAESALRRSLALDTTNAAYSNLAQLYLHEKRYADAVAASDKAIALNGQEILSWRYAELAYRWLGEHQKADRALDQVETSGRGADSDESAEGRESIVVGIGLREKRPARTGCPSS